MQHWCVCACSPLFWFKPFNQAFWWIFICVSTVSMIHAFSSPKSKRCGCLVLYYSQNRQGYVLLDLTGMFGPMFGEHLVVLSGFRRLRLVSSRQHQVCFQAMLKTPNSFGHQLIVGNSWRKVCVISWSFNPVLPTLGRLQRFFFWKLFYTELSPRCLHRGQAPILLAHPPTAPAAPASSVGIAEVSAAFCLPLAFCWPLNCGCFYHFGIVRTFDT